MADHVIDDALCVAAERCSGSRGFDKQRIDDGAIGERRLIENFELSTANGEVCATGGRFATSDTARGAEQALAKRNRQRHFLVEIAEQLPIQSAGVAEVQ